MVGIYFSGTGNTEHCIKQFVKNYDEAASAISIEDASAIPAIRNNDLIIFAYPVYYSNLPKIVRDFMEENKKLFKNKKIFIIATMGLFSGDGAGCSARIFRKYGANVIGGLHLKMPDCIGDVKLLKKSLEKNKRIVTDAEKKINNAVMNFKKGKLKHDGINIIDHIAGLFCQRLWFYHKTRKYSDQLKINQLKCIGCGMCSKKCPMDNLEIRNGVVKTKGLCTMCYRCISNCPKQAITLIGKEVYEQCKIERYL
jgi:Formate hydrogenlyase subunit 6/NADH:ubiquinone oxidoreductase 23 kD subunit (chain I)